jgi:hypothetical protein
MAEAAKFDGQGARIIAGCILGNLVTSKTVFNATFGVFLRPVTAALGWPRAEFSAVLLIMSIVGIVGYPLAGRAADRFGFRKVFPLGLVIFSMAVASLYFIPAHKIAVYLDFCLIGFAAAFSSTVVLGKPISARFGDKPGSAFALTECGMNLGFAVMPLIAAWLLSRYGWRPAYLALAILVLVAGAPAWLLIGAPSTGGRRAGASPTPLDGLAAAEARRTPAFWLLLGGATLGAGAIGATTSHMIPILTDRGFPLGVAALVFTGWAVASATGQLGVSIILDQTQAPRLPALFLSACVAGLALLGLGSTTGAVVLGGCFVGLSNGALYGLLPFAVRRYFGAKAFGEIFGLIFGLSVLAGGLAPVLMDSVFDHTGRYAPALVWLGLSVACSAGLTAMLPSIQSVGDVGRPKRLPEPLLAAGE